MNAVPVDTAPPRKVPTWRKVVYFLFWSVFVLGIALTLWPLFFPMRSTGVSPQTRALSNAHQIGSALHLYAADHDGKFPEVNPDGTLITSSNQAFRVLFPDYLYPTAEVLCYVGKSAWTPARPDEKLDAPGERPGTNTLRPGENHFAYVRGLRLPPDNVKNALPLVADGFTAPAGGLIGDPVYTDDRARRGGVWEGKVGIVCFADMRAQKMKLTAEGSGANRVFRALGSARTPGGPAKNLFTPDPSDPTWLQPGQGAVDPE